LYGLQFQGHGATRLLISNYFIVELLWLMYGGIVDPLMLLGKTPSLDMLSMPQRANCVVSLNPNALLMLENKFAKF
jgi:hypothetical protein